MQMESKKQDVTSTTGSVDTEHPDRRRRREEPRPSWDEYFMDIVELVGKRSTCLRRKVGAILVKDKRILTTGYNGAPMGIRHCAETGCLRDELRIPSGERHELCRGLHAEQNAIIQAAYHGITINGASLYCTNLPCIICSKMIINAGIREIVYRHGYADTLAEDMLREAGIEVRRL
jgi:dCMP deaminase